MEWRIIEILVVVIGLFLSVGKPVITLNTKLTTLIARLDSFEGDLKRNDAAHVQIQKQMDEDEAHIADHEVRISILERK